MYTGSPEDSIIKIDNQYYIYILRNDQMKLMKDD